MCASHLNAHRKSTSPCEQQGGLKKSQTKTEWLYKHARFDFVTWDYSVVSAGPYPERVGGGGERQYIFSEYGDTLVSLVTCCQCDH